MLLIQLIEMIAGVEDTLLVLHRDSILQLTQKENVLMISLVQ